MRPIETTATTKSEEEEKRMTHSNAAKRSLPTALALVVCSATVAISGCGAYADESFDDEEVGTQEDEIRNGTVVSKRGVVEIGGCTGAMIGPNHVITAAHCIDADLSGKEGFIRRTVRYYDPRDTSLAPGESRKVSGDNEQMFAWIKSTYAGSGDTESDIAVVERGNPWIGTESNDYLRLSLGSCSQMDKNTLYGRGVAGFSGDGAGTLRMMSIDLHSCSTHQFHDLAGSRQTCKGDSGGPHTMKVIVGDDAWDVIVGLHTSSEKPSSGSGLCSEGGGKQFGVRMNSDKTNFIESIVGPCSTYTADDGHKYKRCW
jgi:V8-like Glu-specific endopeptidase